MYRILSPVLVVACFAVSASAQDKPAKAESQPVTATSISTVNARCPMMPKPARDAFFVDTANGRVNLCCKKCLKGAQDDPDGTYKRAYPGEPKKVESKMCPVSGHELGKTPETILWQGHSVQVCCKDCVAAFKEEADVHIALMTHPDVKDAANKMSPVSGKPVAKNTAVIVGSQLIRLADAAEVDEMKKSPADYVKRLERLGDKAEPKKADPKKPEPKKDGEKKGG